MRCRTIVKLFAALPDASRTGRKPEKFMGKSSRRKRERQEVPLLELPSWMPRDIQIERNHGGAKISNSLHELVKPSKRIRVRLNKGQLF